jgi:hypothetical protein
MPIGWALPSALAPAKRSPVRNTAFVTAVVAVLLIAAVGGGVYAVFGGSSSSTNSARSVASATVTDLSGGNYERICTLAAPSQAFKCASDLKELTIAQVKYTDLALGAVTVDGDRAVFVVTGTVCVGANRRCLSNHDADLDRRLAFNQVYAAAIGTKNASPFLLAIVFQDGHWYVTGF